MANLLSPGVYIEEVDASAIVPNVSANVAFLAGNFHDGPVEQAYVVTNKKEYEEIFGTPTDENYNEWFQGYKFFDYANQLIVSRAYQLSSTVVPTDGSEYIEVYQFTGPVNITDNPGGALGHGINVLVSEDFDYKLQAGEYVSLADVQEFGTVWSITEELIEITTGVFQKQRRIAIEMDLPVSVAFGDPLDIPTLKSDEAIKLYSNGHANGGTQAYQLGEIDEYGKPATANASEVMKNIDVVNVDGTENGNRLNYGYDLIKNDGDFDYKLDQNELTTFKDGMKLKFFARNPNSGSVEIAIANMFDFQSIDSDNNNFAVAFQETVGTNVEYTYLQSLFDYNPLADEIAIAIKKGEVIETFVVSLDPLSIDGNGKNNYIETVINETSKFIYVKDNEGINDKPATYLVYDKYGQVDGILREGGVPTTILTVIGGRDPKVDKGGMTDAYFVVEDKERYEIDIIIGNEDFVNIAIDLAEARKDCLAYIGARYEDTVGKKAFVAVNEIRNYLADGDGGEKVTRSMFAAMFTNYFRIYDKYNKKYRWINVAGDMAGIRCDVTSNTAPWWVSAGMKRGIIRNINKLAFTPSQALRDNLYKDGMNPIVSFPGTGNLVWGNKTLYPIASSFDRINVRTLFNTIERAMAKAARSQVFEFNDPYTRNAIMSMFNPYLSSIKAGRGITDYLVICDETNNTPDVISRNELRADIYIKPAYAAEMILLTFTNVGTRSFSDVVGV